MRGTGQQQGSYSSESTPQCVEGGKRWLKLIDGSLAEYCRKLVRNCSKTTLLFSQFGPIYYAFLEPDTAHA
jgi:hypothetical protein